MLPSASSWMASKPASSLLGPTFFLRLAPNTCPTSPSWPAADSGKVFLARSALKSWREVCLGILTPGTEEIEYSLMTRLETL